MLRSIVEHLRSALPSEGCGLLATVRSDGDRLAVRFFPGDNIDRSATRYTMDPRQVMTAMVEMERAGWRLGAIAHSHPATPAVPSATDAREAYYPDAWLLIVSFMSGEPEIRVWDMADVAGGGRPRELPLHSVPG